MQMQGKDVRGGCKGVDDTRGPTRGLRPLPHTVNTTQLKAFYYSFTFISSGQRKNHNKYPRYIKLLYLLVRTFITIVPANTITTSYYTRFNVLLDGCRCKYTNNVPYEEIIKVLQYVKLIERISHFCLVLQFFREVGMSKGNFTKKQSSLKVRKR